MLICACVCMCVYECVLVSVCACMCVCVYMCVHVSALVCLCVYVCACLHLCACVSLCAHVCTCVGVYVVLRCILLLSLTRVSSRQWARPHGLFPLPALCSPLTPTLWSGCRHRGPDSWLCHPHSPASVPAPCWFPLVQFLSFFKYFRTHLRW